jgi:DNA-binding transcriptional LysR family regulator
VLRLGVPANLPDQLLPDVLLALADAAPGLHVRTVSMSTSEQIAALHAGELDAGLVRQAPEHEGLVGRIVHVEPVGVALPSGHRLAAQQSVHAADLERLELVTAPPAMMPGFAAELMRALGSAGWRHGQVRESPDTEATLGLVAAGLGAAPMLETSVDRHSAGRAGRIVWRPLADVHVDSRLWCAWHPERRSAQVGALLHALPGPPSG